VVVLEGVCDVLLDRSEADEHFGDAVDALTGFSKIPVSKNFKCSGCIFQKDPLPGGSSSLSRGSESSTGTINQWPPYLGSLTKHLLTVRLCRMLF
jgi:hypothetical protein